MNKEKQIVNPELVDARKKAPFQWFGAPESEHAEELSGLEHAYMRWCATRYENRFISEQDATGFEGYFEGLKLSPEAVAIKIAELGRETLATIKALHSSDAGFMSKVWSVAKGEGNYNQQTQQILRELGACLGSKIARLRVQVLPDINPQGSDFRQEIANMVKEERIVYHDENGVVKEHTIAVPRHSNPSGAIKISADLFYDKDQKKSELLKKGFEFMQLLGRSGYPLARLATRYNPS